MKYIIDEKTKKPAYLQLYHQLREDITGGVYSYGEKLPSKRLVADELGVSVITVEHAYALLCEEGYVEARERSGYFAIFRSDDSFLGFPTENEISQSRVLPHSAGETEAFPFSVLAKVMRRVISDYGEAILQRGENSGCEILRSAIAHYLARSRGITVSPRQIIIGSGAEYLYGLVVELLGRNRIYAIEAPSYEKIEQVYRAADVRYESLPLSKDGIESKALSNTRAEVLHITPYRSFPSGVTASASKRYEYIRWANRGERYIVEDDFESEFSVSTKSEETLFSLSTEENVIYINTFSKTLSSAFRAGYMVLPERLVPLFEEKLGFYSCTVPTFEQFVLSELISKGDFERHINRVRRKKRREG
ncbi:MAG: PLP-dependent aminotransferase family protein [Ruminococcaceae bacterium]|nr:PLP-dependent aminotransferase family protein [Oscillospiraceae bacterium]